MVGGTDSLAERCTMQPSGERHWVPAALAAGVAYAIVGVGFGALAGAAAPGPPRARWRLAAWVVSAIIFAAHLAREHFRLHATPRAAAWHVALAVAIGAFALAAAANLHGHPAAVEHRLRISLVVWPLLSALPAMLVALVLAAALARARRGA